MAALVSPILWPRMFLGHFALALAAKRAAPRASLGALFIAAQWADLLWPPLLLAGLERVSVAPGDTAATPLRFDSYPISHSLLALAGWALAGALLYYLHRGDRRGTLVVLLLVVSHWVLDAVTHRPDLPLSPWGTTRVGLGLWNAPGLTLAIETLMFLAGASLYLRGTRALDRTGRYALWALLGFLALVHLGNLFGPPPPSSRAVAYAALALWLFPLWAWWADRHRSAADWPGSATLQFR